VHLPAPAGSALDEEAQLEEVDLEDLAWWWIEDAHGGASSLSLALLSDEALEGS